MMWRHFAIHNRRFAAAVLVSTLTTLSNVALLGTSAFLIARAAQMPPVLTLTVAVVSVRALALGRAVGRYTERLLSHDATFRSLADLRASIYQAVERAAPAGVGHLRRGDTLSRAVTDVERLQDLPLRVVLPAISSVASALLVSGAAVAIHPAAGAAVALSLAVAALLAPWTALRTAAATEASVATTTGALTDSLLDLLDGHADLEMLGMTHHALDRVHEVDSDLVQKARRLARGTGAASAVTLAAQTAALAASVVAAGNAVDSGSLSPVMAIVVGLLPLAVFETVAALPGAALAWVAVRTSSDRVEELLAVAPPHEEPTCAHQHLAGDLVLNDVTAAWSEVPAVRNLSLRVGDGQTTALAGPSGGGKSTILAVLAGLLRPTAGRYTVGGTDTAHVCGSDLRQHITLSMQDAHIFATSVAENLRLAARSHRIPSDDDIRGVLHAVGLGEWLATLPEGIDSLIGENGATLSGGQRQRLLAARMLIADADVWLLDEPTEHLDPPSAAALLATLIDAADGRTVVVATHLAPDVAAAHAVVSVVGDHGTMGA